MAADKKIQSTAADKKEEKVQPVVKLKHLTIKLPEDLHRKLKSKAALEGENVKNIMQRLVLESVVLLLT